ncbi:hypothetical protein PQ459_00255 [Chryseobacterium sp. KACC 21268]|nr:hypothetical protein PQ459_00255 [Chryseobacterium sp. KACC 21268]
MKEFLSKLIDRNLQRKRESGITSYVLYSLVILTAYKLFGCIEFLLIDSIFEFDNLPLTVCLIAFLFNMLFINGSFFYYLFPNLKNFKHLKVIKNENLDNYQILSLFVSFPLGLLLNLYLFFSPLTKDWKLLTYAIIFFIAYILGCIMSFYLYLNNNVSSPPTIQSHKQKSENRIIFLLIILSIIINSSSFYFIYNISIEYKVEIIKISILIYLLYAIFEKILQVNALDNYYSKLEDFEYEIKLRDLPEEQIKKEFQEKFSGFLVNDWIANQYRIFTSRKFELEETINYYNSLAQDLESEYSSSEKDTFYFKKSNDIKNGFNIGVNKFKNLFMSQIQELEDMSFTNCDDLEIYERQKIQELIKEIKNEL